MIDDAFLSGLEGYTRNLGNAHAAEIIRNARRYLALLENEVLIMRGSDQNFDVDGYRARHNAAADQLLEGGE